MNTVKENRFTLGKGTLLPLGAVADKKSVQFTFEVRNGKKAGVNLYHREKQEKHIIAADKKYHTGNL